MEIERADIQIVAPLDDFLFYIIQSICPENRQIKWKLSTIYTRKACCEQFEMVKCYISFCR